MGTFFLRVCLCLPVLLVAWYWSAHWLAVPVSGLASAAMRHLFPDWVNAAELSGTTMALLTDLRAVVPGSTQLALLVPEASYLLYGYGLPFYLALLLASRARLLLWKALAGSLLLLPFQVTGVCFDWLKQAVFSGGPYAVHRIGFAAWQSELVALGFQFSSLVLPSLVPVLLWLALDRRFAAAVFMEGWLSGAAGNLPEKKAEQTDSLRD